MARNMTPDARNSTTVPPKTAVRRREPPRDSEAAAMVADRVTATRYPAVSAALAQAITTASTTRSKYWYKQALLSEMNADKFERLGGLQLDADPGTARAKLRAIASARRAADFRAERDRAIDQAQAIEAGHKAAEEAAQAAKEATQAAKV